MNDEIRLNIIEKSNIIMYDPWLILLQQRNLTMAEPETPRTGRSSSSKSKHSSMGKRPSPPAPDESILEASDTQAVGKRITIIMGFHRSQGF